MATQYEVAQHINLSDRQVRELTKTGVLPGSKGRGGYDLDACRLAYINYLRGKSTRQIEGKQGNIDGAVENARLTMHKANLAELEEAKQRGELVAINEIVETLAAQLGNVRAKLLNMPARLTVHLLGETDRVVVQDLIERSVTEALEELTIDGEYEISESDTTDDNEKPKAAA